MAADSEPKQAVVRQQEHVRPRRGFVTASGGAALVASVTAIWLAAELRIGGSGWLPWIALTLPMAAAGVLCLVRRPATSTGPAAVFASCTVAGSYALQIPPGHYGLALAVSLLLLLCIGVSVIISATVTVVMISISGTVSRRRAAVWTAAALLFVALSVPSPVRIANEPVQTIFAGNTGDQNALAVCGLVLLVVPLVIIGLAPARMAAVMILAWLPEAAAQLLAVNVFRFSIIRLDAWYYVAWLCWLIVAVLGLAEASGRRPGRQRAQRAQ